MMSEHDEPVEQLVAQRGPALALTPATRCEATLVFADLFGYCAFTEARDIEQVAAVLGAIKLEAARIVHAHGGIVNQFVGDEVVALFGVPKGGEDATRRAIEAALELHAFVRSTNLGHWLAHDGNLCLHTGIDAGVVLVSTRDVRDGLFELTGAAVNRAARLRSAAGADEILVSQRVHARIAQDFCAEQLGAHSFKGIAESSTPYRIRSRRAAAPHPPTPAARTLSVPNELAGLHPETVRVLSAAAIARGRIEVGLLARATRLELPRARAALEDAALARLIVLDDRGHAHFSHAKIRDLLHTRMSSAEQRRWNQRLAKAMRERPEPNDAYAFALAQHCAEGLLEEDPCGAFEALHVAAGRALAACEDTLALTFLRPAELAAQRAQLDPGHMFYAQLAETSLRAGELNAALASFEAAAERCGPGFEHAHLIGRMAWIRHYRAEGSRPLSMLEAALAECGMPVAERDWSMLVASAAAWSWRSLPVTSPAALTPRELEILCGLYIQYFRVSCENARPLRGTAAVLRLAALSRELPPSRVRVQCDVTVAFLVAASGARARARSMFERAFSMAHELGDPVAITFCHQLAHVSAGWQGDFSESEREAEACVDERGQYMELGELCHLCFGMAIIELYRGRIEHALAWVERAIERVERAGHAPAVFTLVEEAACSLLVSLGRQEEIVRMQSRLRCVARGPLGNAGYFHQISFLFRAQVLAAREDPGEELDRLVEEFARLELEPAHVHLGMVTFYAVVANMRVHQCLRADEAERAACVAKLARALADVQASERIPAQQPLTKLIRGAYAWFNGQERKAEKLLAEAENSARERGIVGVNYGAARLRAHMLRARGKGAEALDQARVAALFARQYGQEAGLRFVRHEFGLEA